MSQSSTPIVRHTDAEVESLKRQWRQDPCWDLTTTEGFEAHRDELAAYEAAYWTEAQQAMERKVQTDRESQPAYWLKELVTEVRTLNAHLANIDSRLCGITNTPRLLKAANDAWHANAAVGADRDELLIASAWAELIDAIEAADGSRA